jgi:hypothetical protein
MTTDAAQAARELAQLVEEHRQRTNIVRWWLWAIKGRDPVTGATDIREVL